MGVAEIKPMKRIISSVAILALLITLPGCTTTGGTSHVDPNKVAVIIKATVPTAVQIAVGADTNNASYLHTSAAVIRQAATDGQLDAAAIETALQNINSGHGPGAGAMAAISVGLNLYNGLAAQAVNDQITKSDLKLVLTAVADSIDYGLTLPPIHLKSKQTP